ncbi:hypothetical protein SmJEL517_g03396 [Synchytrium microbalum]|uniref:GRIP domain-containing protein n=1 Tax=Synchytrium microbalum TaxID=1806994 RepID=A0A507C8M7_9FUNG|nr:uncharacterized protein SmJEL517_g03396 [Synchytrium microbalum]TPX33855.1 hypothetical protein SmJEL517_g03396 [Synchytrium microbalum]
MSNTLGSVFGYLKSIENEINQNLKASNSDESSPSRNSTASLSVSNDSKLLDELNAYREMVEKMRSDQVKSAENIATMQRSLQAANQKAQLLEQEQAKTSELEKNLNQLRLKAKLKITEMNKEIESLKAKNTSLNSATTNGDNSILIKNELDTLKAEYAAAQATITDLNSRLASSTSALPPFDEAAQDQIEELQTQLSEALQSVEAVEKEKRNFAARIVELEDQSQNNVSELEAELAQYKQMVQAQSADLEELREKANHAENIDIEAAKYRNSLDQLEAAHRQTLEEHRKTTEEQGLKHREALDKQEATYRTALEESSAGSSDTWRNMLEAKEKEFALLSQGFEEQIKTLQERLHKDQQSRDVEISKAQQELLQKLDDERDYTQSEIVALKRAHETERDSLAGQLREATSTLKAVDDGTAYANRIDELTNLLEEAQKRFSEKDALCQELESRLNSMSSVSKEKDELAAHLESLRKTLSRQEEETARIVQGLEKSLSDKQTELSKVQTEAARLQSESSKQQPVNLENGQLGDKLFVFQEQVKDGQIQLASKQAEVASITEQLQQKTDELEKTKQDTDDRIKKMKGIMAAANKSISDNRANIGKKEAEIAELKSQLELERQLRQTRQEVSDTKSEFSSYKIKAAAALQKNSSTLAESRIRELEDTIAKLERDKMDSAREAETLRGRIKHSESELDEATNQMAVFESQILKLELTAREVVSLKHQLGMKRLVISVVAFIDWPSCVLDAVNRRIELDKEAHDEALKVKDSIHANTIESVRAEARRAMHETDEAIRRKEEEMSSLQAIAERLSSELSSARDDLTRTRADLERLRQVAASATTKSTLSADDVNRRMSVDTHFVDGRPAAASSLHGDGSVNGGAGVSAQRSFIRHSQSQTKFEDLLSVDDRLPSSAYPGTPTTAASSMRDKEYLAQIKALSDMVDESETTIQRLIEQEKILKEEIRKTEREQSRSKDLSTEYLKNVVLSFIEATDRSNMVPIVSQMLHLSPEERERLSKAAARATVVPTDPLSLSFGWG